MVFGSREEANNKGTNNTDTKTYIMSTCRHLCKHIGMYVYINITMN